MFYCLLSNLFLVEVNHSALFQLKVKTNPTLGVCIYLQFACFQFSYISNFNKYEM